MLNQAASYQAFLVPTYIGNFKPNDGGGSVVVCWSEVMFAYVYVYMYVVNVCTRYNADRWGRGAHAAAAMLQVGST